MTPTNPTTSPMDDLAGKIADAVARMTMEDLHHPDRLRATILTALRPPIAPSREEEVELARRLEQTASYYSERHEMPGLVALLEDARAALASIPPGSDYRRGVGEWRSMESAPRDGKWFFACAIERGWEGTRLVRYADKDDRLPTDGTGWVWPSTPTYWMPVHLPARPPAIEGLIGKGER